MMTECCRRCGREMPDEDWHEEPEGFCGAECWGFDCHARTALRAEGGPIWTDHCHHLAGGAKFLGVVDGAEPREVWDVYLWKSSRPEFGEFEVCLRFGELPEQYRSPGFAERVVDDSTGTYATAREIVARGIANWSTPSEAH